MDVVGLENYGWSLRVAHFSSLGDKNIDEQVNKFMEENPDVTIRDIQYRAASFPDVERYGWDAEIDYSVLIVYEIKR